MLTLRVKQCQLENIKNLWFEKIFIKKIFHNLNLFVPRNNNMHFLSRFQVHLCHMHIIKMHVYLFQLQRLHTNKGANCIRSKKLRLYIGVVSSVGTELYTLNCSCFKTFFLFFLHNFTEFIDIPFLQ